MAAITRLFGHAGVVLDVDYSPDGTRLISAGSANTLLWDLSDIPEGNIFRVACAWLPDHDADVSVFEYQANIDEPICDESYDPPPPEWIGGVSRQR